MSWTEYGLAALLAVPAMAVAAWAILLLREMKNDSQEKEKQKQH